MHANQNDYDNAEPPESVDISKLVAGVYDRKDLDEWLVLFLNEYPEKAYSVLVGNAMDDFESWYFDANRDEILEEYKDNG